MDEIELVNGEWTRKSGTYNVYQGTVTSATQISSVDHLSGDGDRNYSAGATTRVYILVTKDRENRLIDGLLVSHDQDGTLKAGAVDVASVIASGIITDTHVNPTYGGHTPVGALVPYAGFSAPSGWLLADGSAVSRSTYATLFSVISPSKGTITVTIATPAVATLNNHGFITGDQVYLTTSGALPTGLSTNTLYYAIKIDANTFNLATSRANALAGTKINTSGTQSGSHTLYYCPYGLGNGSTTFNIPDLRGRVIAGADAMGGTAASRLTLARSQGTYGNVGANGGAETHQLITAELASHTHTLPATTMLGSQSTSGAGTGFQNGAPGSYSKVGLKQDTTPSAENANTGSDTAHNNVQPTLVANYIIKT